MIPFNLRVGERRLLTTNAQLLCRVGDVPALFTQEDQPPVILLTAQEAKYAWRAGEQMAIFDTAEVDVFAAFTEVSRDERCAVYRIDLGDVPADKGDDVLLHIGFTGDHADVYLNGELIADWYTTGRPWQLALKRHDYPPKRWKCGCIPWLTPPILRYPCPKT